MRLNILVDTDNGVAHPLGGFVDLEVHFYNQTDDGGRPSACGGFVDLEVHFYNQTDGDPVTAQVYMIQNSGFHLSME